MSGRKRKAGAAVAAALLIAGIIPGTAAAKTTRAGAVAEACFLVLGSVTPGGDHTSTVFRATSPITVEPRRVYKDIYPDGQVRLSASMASDPDVTGYQGAVSGNVVMGSTMYNSSYRVGLDGTVKSEDKGLTPVGGGWGDMTAFETVRYYPFTPNGVFGVTTQYALRADGTLFRWVVDHKNGGTWTQKQTAPGFAAVKTMAMISQTATYDTFLANTRGGALYTIRIPRTSPMKPIVKQVRSSTWQGFESLQLEKCGQYGTLLVGIDKDTKSAYLYAVGHANGTATVIKGLGKVPGTFADPVYFRHALRPNDAPMLYGE
ncbi:hypothetical protein GCM10009789_23380 [Kribbella sancticallisti]|uniref:Tachylectin n=1 Tax=Kribbella sancticallisti TaxID=460087 RepID=A0ABN2D2Q3_9ACTN